MQAKPQSWFSVVAALPPLAPAVVPLGRWVEAPVRHELG